MAVNWNRRKYTPEEFKEAWLSARSVAECAKLLGLTIYGSTYPSLRDAADELGLDESHMKGQGWARGLNTVSTSARPFSEILVKNSTYTSSSSLKNRLWKAGLLKKECYECGIDRWRGKPAPLALDHINGDNRDNRIDNLRILCYNCHGQTDTWCSKNRKAQ